VRTNNPATLCRKPANGRASNRPDATTQRPVNKLTDGET